MGAANGTVLVGELKMDEGGRGGSRQDPGSRSLPGPQMQPVGLACFKSLPFQSEGGEIRSDRVPLTPLHLSLWAPMLPLIKCFDLSAERLAFFPTVQDSQVTLGQCHAKGNKDSWLARVSHHCASPLGISVVDTPGRRYVE